MPPRQRNVLALIIATFYFVSVYFALSALTPGLLAFQIALVAVLVAMLIFLFLDLTETAEGGLPLGVLLFFPIICIVAGMAWWLLRLLGLWVIR